MKKVLMIMLFLIIPLCFSQQHMLEYFVNDYSDLLTYEEISGIEPILKEIYDSGSAEYAIVIIDSLDGQDIEGYSYRLAEGNLGDAEKNNGLLLLISVQDKRYRFEVGRGLEPVLPDIIMGRIGRNYIEPNFKRGYYAEGIREASLAINSILLNDTESGYYKETAKEEGSGFPLLFFVIIFFIIIIISAARNKSNLRKDDDYFAAAFLLSSMMRGGKGGFGGSGGGFGGFGGGSFGGGGSSGGF